MGKVTDLEDEKLLAYMNEHHPRWYELAEKFGNPIEEINSTKQKGKDLKSNSMKVTILSSMPNTQGKTLNKKLLANMTVGQLKTLCSKLLKEEMLAFKLSFKQEEEEQVY